MKLTTSQHRLIQAMISVIVLYLSLLTNNWLIAVLVFQMLLLAWGALLSFWLIDWANDN